MKLIAAWYSPDYVAPAVYKDLSALYRVFPLMPMLYLIPEYKKFIEQFELKAVNQNGILYRITARLTEAGHKRCRWAIPTILIMEGADGDPYVSSWSDFKWLFANRGRVKWIASGKRQIVTMTWAELAARQKVSSNA